MATTKEYLDYVCTQLEGIRGVDYKRMFGAKPQKTLDVENRALTAQIIEILERVTPVSKRRAKKTYGMP